MNISEKVSYIKGLAEGMKLDESTNEGKLLTAILDALTDIAYQLEEVDADLNDMADVVGDIDETVAELEEAVYGDDDDHCDCGCEDEDMYEITCPKCDNSIVVDFDVIASGEILCPNCGEPLEFDLSELEDEED
ncbi:MAG: hypothetical protein J1F60_05070 [Oscillospiraceae bacterium]|nr:hypothetical protein [Oscillospiraceae bacterium]